MKSGHLPRPTLTLFRASTLLLLACSAALVLCKHLTLPVEPHNYTTRVDFGSNGDSAQLQLSMQSDWTFVMAAPECEKCPNRRYEYANSTSHRNGTHTKKKVEIGKQKDKVVLEGFSSVDLVCVYLER